MSEDQKELIHTIKKLTNSIDKLNILFEYVRKELIDDYDKQNNSEALLKKLVQQNKIIAQGMVKLADRHDSQENALGMSGPSQPQIKDPNPSEPSPQLQGNNQNPAFNNQQIPDAMNESAVPNYQTNPGQQPKMDFSNFKGVNDSPPMPETKQTSDGKKGFLGMFKKWY